MFKLFLKSLISNICTSLVTVLVRFYYVQDAKSMCTDNTGRIIHRYVLMVGKKDGIVLSEGKAPVTCW